MSTEEYLLIAAAIVFGVGVGVAVGMEISTRMWRPHCKWVGDLWQQAYRDQREEFLRVLDRLEKCNKANR